MSEDIEKDIMEEMDSHFGDDAEVAEITDTQRIDWLQENNQTVWMAYHSEKRMTTETELRYEKVTVFDGWAVLEECDPKPTVREAIDEAINHG